MLRKKASNVARITKTASTRSRNTRLKITKDEEEAIENDVPISEYMNMVNAKKIKNKKKLQQLGLIETTPPLKDKTIDRKSTPKKKNNRGQARKKLNIKCKAIESNVSDEEECPYDHACFSTSYKEENDKRYLAKNYDLFGVKCQGCEKAFDQDEKCETSVTPTNAAPMYVCLGRSKHKCVHSYCYECYQSRFMEHNPRKRRRSTRKN